MPHPHEFIPIQIEEFDDFYYARCKCGAIQGSPIYSKEEKEEIINYLATCARY